jgi:hypothetical protein
MTQATIENKTRTEQYMHDTTIRYGRGMLA